MDCQQASDAMDAAILGENNVSQQAEFDSHLAVCSTCRSEYQAIRSGLDLDAQSQAGTAITNPLAARIAAMGAAELWRDRQSSLLRRRARHIVALLSAAAAIAIMVWIARFDSTPSSSTTSDAGRVSDDSWCFVNGDAANSRRCDVPDLGIPTQTIWDVSIPGAAGTFKPLAWNHLVIVGTPGAATPFRRGGGLAALDARNGTVAWRKTFAQGDYFKAKGFPDRCILQGKLYITDGSVCRVLDAGSGKELAVLPAPDSASGWSYLGAQGERLYGVSSDGRTVFCVNWESGAKVWCHAASGQVFVPALSAGHLLVQSSNGTLTALNGSDGRLLWSRANSTLAGKGSVYVSGDRVLVLTDNDELTACDAASGKLLWQRKLPHAHQSGLALGRAAVYVLAGRMALDLSDGHTLWQQTELVSGACAPPTVVGNALFCTGAKSACLNVLSDAGALVASVEEVPSQACEGAIVAKGRVYTGGDGRFRALVAWRQE